MAVTDPERDKRAKKAVLVLFLFAISIIFAGILFALAAVAVFAIAAKIYQYYKRRRGTGGSTSREIGIVFGKIVKILFYLAIFALIVGAAMYLITAVLEKQQNLENKLYVYSQSGSGMVGDYTKDSFRVVGGREQNTTFVIRTTKSIEGSPEFDAWISSPEGTPKGATMAIRILDVKKIGDDAVFRKVLISHEKTGYGAFYELGRMVSEVADGQKKARVEDRWMDYHTDKREYIIEIEVNVPRGGIVDFEKVKILNKW